MIGTMDYLNIENSIATGVETWYAGNNSVNGGNNTGWVFTAPPSESTSALILPGLQASATATAESQATVVAILPALQASSYGLALAVINAQAALLLPSPQGSSVATAPIVAGSAGVLPALQLEALSTVLFVGIPHDWLSATAGVAQTWWQAGPVMIKEEG